MTTVPTLDRLAVAVVICSVFPNRRDAPADIMEFCLKELLAACGPKDMTLLCSNALASRVDAVLRSLAFPDTAVADELLKMRAAYAVLNYEHQSLRAAAQRVMSEMPIGPGASPAMIALGGNAYRPTAT